MTTGKYLGEWRSVRALTLVSAQWENNALVLLGSTDVRGERPFGGLRGLISLFSKSSRMRGDQVERGGASEERIRNILFNPYLVPS